MRLRLLNQLLQTAAVSLLLLFIAVVSYNSYAQSELQETGVCGVSDHNYPMVPDSLPSAAKGQDLWNENACGACHNKNMKVDATGPALSGVTERWQDYPRADLYNFIRGSQSMVASNHPRAKTLNDSWASVMQDYPDLSDEEIEHLIAYIEFQYTRYSKTK